MDSNIAVRIALKGLCVGVLKKWSWTNDAGPVQERTLHSRAEEFY
jgi:hypothetical protein